MSLKNQLFSEITVIVSAVCTVMCHLTRNSKSILSEGVILLTSLVLGPGLFQPSLATFHHFLIKWKRSSPITSAMKY